MTVNQFYSDIINDFKAITLDSYLSPKFIISKAKSIVADFLAKDNNQSKLVNKLIEGWVEVLVPMEEENVQNFVEFGSNLQYVMKSKYRLPQLYSGKYGGLIKDLSSINYMTSYSFISSPRLWKATQDQEFKSKKYFLFVDGYVLIPIPKGEQSSPELIRLTGFFKDLFEVQKYNELVGQAPKSCKSALEYEFPCPYPIENSVKKEVLNQLTGIYSRIIKDDLPNLNQSDKDNPRNP